MNKQEIRTRYEWIDVAKGIAILLVMWGHIVAIHDAFYDWVTSFHVPVFLVITGFLFFAQNKQKNDFKKTLTKIRHPYWVFSVVSIVTDCMWSYCSGGGADCCNKINFLRLL